MALFGAEEMDFARAAFAAAHKADNIVVIGQSDIGAHRAWSAQLPAFAVRQDASRYFDWRHSSEDTLDKIDRDQLNQAVATWAAFAYIAANSDIDFRALAPAPAKPGP